MEKRLVLVLLLALLFRGVELYSQEPCKVLKQEIAAKYDGKCKNGLAQGKGIAEGVDKYEGQFKDGLPHGNGKYTFANGEVYEGKWKEGKKQGEGKLLYKKNGVDSVKVGVWENDVFAKRIIPKPYKVKLAYNINRYSIIKIGGANKVIFSFMQNGSSNAVFDVSFTASSGTEFESGSKQGLDNIAFPFTCKVTYSTLNALKTNNISATFEFEINEPGAWEIVLNN